MSVLSESPRIAENELAFAIYDKYPMAPGHILVCTKREVASWFDSTRAEREDVHALLAQMAKRQPPGARGYRIMVNVGAAQHIPHIHAHLIPHYRDTP